MENEPQMELLFHLEILKLNFILFSLVFDMMSWLQTIYNLKHTSFYFVTFHVLLYL